MSRESLCKPSLVRFLRSVNGTDPDTIQKNVGNASVAPATGAGQTKKAIRPGGQIATFASVQPLEKG
jgi:hypothetical protein